MTKNHGSINSLKPKQIFGIGNVCNIGTYKNVKTYIITALRSALSAFIGPFQKWSVAGLDTFMKKL